MQRRSNIKNPLSHTTTEDDNNVSMDQALSILGQEKRLEIMRVLLGEKAGCGVTTLSKVLHIKAPTVEKHLTTLKKLGLVKKQVTLDFARERWVIRGHKRVSKLLSILESDVSELLEVGRIFEEVETAVRRQQYYKEQAASSQEMENARKEGEKLDRLLEQLHKNYSRLLDEDELKKVNYWLNARNLGVF